MSRDELAREIVKRGCPTDTRMDGDSYCFYCGGDYHRIEGAKVTTSDELNHRGDCPWPPFEEAYKT